MSGAHGGPHAIDRIRTLRIPEFGTMLWLEITTADGTVGVGEGCLGPESIEAYIHEVAAPYLLGRDAREIERHDRELRSYVGHDGATVEMRGNGAVNIALWDLAGRALGQPLHVLLGGRVRDRIRVYNTCVGYEYARSGGQLSPAAVGLDPTARRGRYDDLRSSTERPAELARDLLDEGIRAMKIVSFDDLARATRGRAIDAAGLREGTAPIRRIREAVGREMDVMIELHAQWQLAPMRRIVEALEPFEPLWIEDPLKAGSPATLRELADSTPIPVAISETLAGRQRFRELLDVGGLDILIFDVGWTGGISEARRIADLAETYAVPVAPHDCTGPLLLAASSHLSVHLAGAMLQEHVRAFVHGWYPDVVDHLPPIVDGYMAAPEGPGLGTTLRADAWERPGAVIIERTPRST